MTVAPSSRVGDTCLCLKCVTSRSTFNEWHRRDCQAIGLRCLSRAQSFHGAGSRLAIYFRDRVTAAVDTETVTLSLVCHNGMICEIDIILS